MLTLDVSNPGALIPAAALSTLFDPLSWAVVRARRLNGRHGLRPLYLPVHRAAHGAAR
ncbi:hypothetical protein BN2476_750046 [Paraburkholderia piptadeniae]|uniref:Uncharacterized protein n=1 Tax=Paraburkholderia piptadeniae TaxID=1701573 RepID=A0A1N7SRQ0_9BURK|nr:hypothetical protein BN2476_750046 [Paraburkholderia piptadeniae]